jgi:hypothetical protein
MSHSILLSSALFLNARIRLVNMHRGECAMIAMPAPHPLTLAQSLPARSVHSQPHACSLHPSPPRPSPLRWLPSRH